MSKHTNIKKYEDFCAAFSFSNIIIMLGSVILIYVVGTMIHAVFYSSITVSDFPHGRIQFMFALLILLSLLLMLTSSLEGHIQEKKYKKWCSTCDVSLLKRYQSSAEFEGASKEIITGYLNLNHPGWSLKEV
jgi:hypothetical protein